jgi:hypothetical protein
VEPNGVRLIVVGVEPRISITRREKSLKMAVLKAEIDQFEWAGNVLTHSPTGATFSWQYGKERTGEVVTDWKQAADVLATGDEFDPSEIDILARNIMKQFEGAEAS